TSPHESTPVGFTVLAFAVPTGPASPWLESLVELIAVVVHHVAVQQLQQPLVGEVPRSSRAARAGDAKANPIEAP
ncbi:hypothetical protein CTU88_44110, partial [Streptomyces sp. JV178]|uniref:hypothetical protein n=1 Tax=Streptomyces sp. JV178 TaxID=858632 RepID=UPI000C644618